MSKSKKEIILLGLALLPIIALAQVAPGNQPTQVPISGFADILRILDRLINWVFAILMTLATFLVLYAGFLYVTAGGEPEKVGKAHNVLIYAAVGVAVALVARGFIFVVSSLIS